jgi:hypothetical protein
LNDGACVPTGSSCDSFQTKIDASGQCPTAAPTPEPSPAPTPPDSLAPIAPQPSPAPAPSNSSYNVGADDVVVNDQDRSTGRITLPEYDRLCFFCWCVLFVLPDVRMNSGDTIAVDAVDVHGKSATLTKTPGGGIGVKFDDDVDDKGLIFGGQLFKRATNASHFVCRKRIGFLVSSKSTGSGYSRRVERFRCGR